MVFGKFKNYPIFRYIICDFLKKVSRGSRPTCLAKILCAMLYVSCFGRPESCHKYIGHDKVTPAVLTQPCLFYGETLSTADLVARVPPGASDPAVKVGPPWLIPGRALPPWN